MSSIQNRSAYVVTVRKHPDLTRRFPGANLKAAKAYLLEMRTLHPTLKVDVTQEGNTFQVKVRNKGKTGQTLTFGSLGEADKFMKEIDAQQSRGVFRDYTAAFGVTTAQLIERYIEEECPKL